MNTNSAVSPIIGTTSRYTASIASALLTAALLTVTRLKAPYAMLLADRFLSGAGWLEIAALSLYAGWLVRRFETTDHPSRLRVRIWLAFSIVFFGQLIIGIAGAERFLMTGALHVPVPAVVIAGPLYRGGRFFMPILFLSTIVLVGPAWCSYLCYVGSWDGALAGARSRAGRISRRWLIVRFAVFVATPAAAVALRVLGVAPRSAGLVAIGFGVASVGVMVFVSSRRGTMVHCSRVCPLGLAGNLLGKLSPFRLRVASSCTGCGRCIPACRYAALDSEHLAAGSPGHSCTLCGDCIPACPDGALGYRFLRLPPAAARTLFLVLVVSLHAVFLGVARI